MTQAQQPEALRLAEQCDNFANRTAIATCLRAQYHRILELEGSVTHLENVYGAAIRKVVELEQGKYLHQIAEPETAASMLTFVNGKPAKCGCRFSYSDGGGEYSDVGSVTLCAKHAGTERNGIERAEPFMWAIQEPGGGAYMDEGCVSSVREDVQAEVDGLNSGLDADDDPYQVVPVYLAAAPQAVQTAVPVAGQSRFKGEKDWHWCSPEHVAMVLATPSEWQGYEARYLYAHAAPAHPAEGVANEDEAFEKWWSTPHVWGLGHKAAQRSAFAAGVAHAAATQPAALGMDALYAARWREVLQHVGAAPHFGGQHFTLNTLQAPDTPLGFKANLMSGSAAQHFTKAIDAAIAARAEQGGA
jgi:hypothetical protein